MSTCHNLKKNMVQQLYANLHRICIQQTIFYIYLDINKFMKVMWFPSTLFGCSGGWLFVCIGSLLHSVRFGQLLCCAHKRIVNRFKVYMGNSNVTDITFQRFLETLGAHFIYLQVLNLKSFIAITKQSSWIVHPMRLRSIFWISYEISYIMTAVTDITFFGSHILHTNTFVEKSEFMDFTKAFSLLI